MEREVASKVNKMQEDLTRCNHNKVMLGLQSSTFAIRLMLLKLVMFSMFAKRVVHA